MSTPMKEKKDISMRITINDIDWYLEETNDPEMLAINGDRCFSITDFQSQKIWIRAGMQVHMKQQMIMREILQAMLFSHGFTYNMTEETLCEFVGANIRRIMKIMHAVESEMRNVEV